VRFGISSYTAVGTSAVNVLCAGLTIGDQYELSYWLDCQPDVAGYVEQWTRTGIVWTQPAATDPAVLIAREQG